MTYEPLHTPKKGRIGRFLKISLVLTILIVVALLASELLSSSSNPTKPKDAELDGGIPIEVLSAIDSTTSPSHERQAATLKAKTSTNQDQSAAEHALSTDSALESEPAPHAPKLERTTIEVTSGMSLSLVFEQAGLGYSQMLAVLEAGEEAARLANLRVGDEITFITDPANDNALLRIELPISDEQLLVVERDDDNKQWLAQINDLPVEITLIAAGGLVRGSLYQSAVNAGVPPAQVMQLADIFGWKIDFIRDVRDGDEFKLIYQSRERDGEHLSNGRVVAAEYINRGQSFKAVYYANEDGYGGYYDPDGASLERSFLRYPVEFTRISSHYNLERLHPIYNTVREHIGVDLAAPSGTPIHAAGDGEIIFQGWKHGYGRVVEIRHDNTYKTLYAHMSRFASGQGRGTRVAKGDVIGYVGMTGTATGPHLHYEFHVNGQHTDPLKVDLPEANPIDKADLDDFKRATHPLLQILAENQFNEPTRLAEWRDQ